MCEQQESIADIASIFAEFFADLNVASSDLAAGFVLLSKYQAAQRQWIVKNQQYGVEQYLSGVPITQDTIFLDISTAEDSHLINDLIYYMNYSLAIFGWPMQMLDDPCMLCCICPYLKLSSGSSKSQKNNSKKKADKSDDKNKKNKSNKNDKLSSETKSASVQTDNNNRETIENPNNNSINDNSNNINSNNNDNIEQITRRTSVPGKLDEDCDVPIVSDDNCCSCNSASAERRLRAHNYEIIYVSYRVSVNVVPFLVAADHSKQSIVVALRGSMSISDMVTDMNGQADKLPIDNCPDDWLGHKGIIRAALHVKTLLVNEHILSRAFNCRPDLGSPNYNLILCGHSLGAGAAAILGILLRPLYPNLKAYLYSPPGGILSMPAVEYTKEFSFGIILGNDTVPRLGLAQLERLRYHTLLSLRSSQKSASKILCRALCPTCCLGGNQVDYDPTQSLNLLHGTEGRSFDYNGNKIPFQVQPQVLYVPGRLIHIVKNYTFKSRAGRLFNEPIYQAIWTDNAHYDRIIVSKGMLFDHLPNYLMHGMKMLFSKTLPGRKESRSSVTVPISDVAVPDPFIESLSNDPNNNNIAVLKDSIIISNDKILAESQAVTKDENNNNNNNNDNNNNSDETDRNDLAKIGAQLYPNLSRRAGSPRADKVDSNKLEEHIAADNVIGNKEKLDENGNEQI